MDVCSLRNQMMGSDEESTVMWCALFQCSRSQMACARTEWLHHIHGLAFFCSIGGVERVKTRRGNHHGQATASSRQFLRE